jgi:hypothetical protein
MHPATSLNPAPEVIVVEGIILVAYNVSLSQSGLICVVTVNFVAPEEPEIIGEKGVDSSGKIDNEPK